MDKGIMELAYRINEELKNEPAVREYFRYKEAIDKSDLPKIEEHLKELQQSLVHALDQNRKEDHERLRKEYEELKSYYDNHPLIVNYRYLVETVNELLQQVAFMIDKEMNS